jgi:hypothetical protein
LFVLIEMVAMKRLLSILLITGTAGVQAFACDRCASNMGLGGLGLAQVVERHQLGLIHSTARYQSNHHGNTDDLFHIAELGASWYAAKSLRLSANLPVQWNQRSQNGQRQTVSGVGDLRVMGYYRKTMTFSTSEEPRLILDAGLGLKLPTGKYEAKLGEQELPENFTIGNGCIGAIAQPAAGLSWDNGGVLLSGNLVFHFPSEGGYRFGNQFSAQLTAYREWRLGSRFRMVPTLGMMWEHSARDRMTNGYLSASTGGYGVLLPLGLGFRWESLYLNLQYAFPVAQQYASGDTELQHKLGSQLHFFF